MTYLLAGVVLLIWGLVVYRIFSAVNEEEASFMPSAPPLASSRPKGETLSDTFELIADYRDPFLGKMSASGDPAPIRRAVVRKKPVLQATPAPPVDWSFIAFLGTIRNKQGHKEIGLFRIRGQEVMMSAPETRGDVSVLKVGKDSAWISYQGIKKALTKSY